MQLTTPELQTYDTSLPGENWFLYWRTSPSLWETKLRQYKGTNPIFVPLYWGLHSHQPGQFDFGTLRPETDLKRLANLSNLTGKEIIFILPLVPSPFLANGGIPAYLARNMMISEDGLGCCIVDNDGRLNKLYSFYDPRIFQAFRGFVWNLGQYFSQSGISLEIYGADFGHMTGGVYSSYFNDKSVAFEQGFHRYLKQVEQNEPDKYAHLKQNFSYERELKEQYADMVKNLYRQAAQESISGNWNGILTFSFLGGAPDDIFARTSQMWEFHGDFFNPLFEIVVNNIIPSSVLLSGKMKKNILAKALSDVVSSNFLASHLDNNMYDEDLHMSFQPLVYFNLYLQNNSSDNLNFLSNGGISYFFERDFPWMYRMKYTAYQFDAEDDQHQKIHFFFGKYLSQKDFNEMLKLFLNGGKIFLDLNLLADELKNKLDVFLTENSIDVEKVNYLTPILKAQIGDGRLIAYDNEKLSQAQTMKKVGFWQTMTDYLEIKHLKMQVDDNVYYFWTHRISNTYELNYEEIRRVTLYNPTSYKKKVHLISSKNFAFLKTVDESNVRMKSTPIGIDAELLPGGSVSLDFGYFE